MKFVVEDVIEPPFPVVHSLVVLYHELALISDIVETYLGRPALFEHLIVMRDVRRVMIEGRFLKLGQNLFESVYANTAPIGHAIDDIGPALTSIWLTRTIALTAVLRCESLDEWETDDAVGRLEALTEETIIAVKDALTQDLLPILKLRLRHYAPEGTTDTVAFSRSVIEGIAKTLDALAGKLKRQPAEKTTLFARRQTVYDEPPATETEVRVRERSSRKSRSRHRGGMFRVFHTFAQKLKYTVGGGRGGR
jgi:hypothetical protein